MMNMKIKVIPTIIVLLLSALLGYAVYSFANNEQQRCLLAIITSVVLFATMFGIFGFSLKNPRRAANIHTLSIVFSILFVIVFFIYSCLKQYNVPLLIILTGILFLIWILIVYGIGKAKQ